MSHLSRRSFAESLAAAALAPLVGIRPESIRLAHPGGSFAHSVGDDPGKLAKALAEVIRTQYGSRLSTGDLDSITRQVQTGLERVGQLGKLELMNGDEPDFRFSAIRSTSRSS